MPALVLSTVILFPAYIGWKAWHLRRQLQTIPRMTVEALLDKLTTSEPPLLIDVRPRPTVEAEPGIPNALHIALEDLAHRHGELPRSRDLVLYCACPADAASAQGVLLLQQKGFSRVWPLAGGLEAWRATAEGTVSVRMIQVQGLAS